MSEKLLPCPFCGHKPKMRNDLNGENEPYYQVRHDCMCLLSEIKTFCHKTEAEAIAAWNRRADGWIPVEERLPEEGEIVIVSNGGFINMVLNVFDAVEGATHWMPMPSPPKGVVLDE